MNDREDKSEIRRTNTGFKSWGEEEIFRLLNAFSLNRQAKVAISDFGFPSDFGIGNSDFDWGCCPTWEIGETNYVGAMNARAMTDKVQDWQKRATETARNVGSATDQYVRENTWTTIAVAAVFGCVLGFLLGSRRE
jgi:hypothetical protein